MSLSRRTVVSGVVAGAGLPALVACGAEESPGSASPSASSSAPSSAGDPSASAPAGGGGFAKTSEIPVGGGVIYPDQGVVVTQPTKGEFKGFSNICTHQGCPLAAVTETIDCSCHGSKFSITDGSVANGPATDTLPAVDVTVKGDQISLP
jgi:Rieske Fe-S protein